MKKIYVLFLSMFAVITLYLCSYANDTVSISGKVLTNMGLNNVTIKVSGTKITEKKTKTDRLGTYIITGLPKGGTYTITASKDGYSFSPETKSFKDLQESQIDQNFFASPLKFSIRGKVLDGKKPVKGVAVVITNRSIKNYTNDEGVYMLDNLDYKGNYEIKVDSNKHIFEPFKVKSLEKNIIHNFSKDILIRGKVTSFGHGIPGIEININNSIYKTKEDGSYVINDIYAKGTYYLTLNSTKYDSNPPEYNIKNIISDQFCDFEIFGTVSGKITYKNKPLQDVILKLTDNDTGTEQIVKTDSSGNYKFTKVGLNQQYEITVSSQGYSFIPEKRIIKSLIKENDVQNFKADIEKHNLIIKAVQGEKPVEKATIILNFDEEKTYTTDKNGICVLKNLIADNQYNIAIKKENTKFIESMYSVDGLSKDEEIHFEALVNVSGVVYDDNNIGVENVVVSYGSKKDEKVKTDKNGKYTLNLEYQKAYTIKASGNNLVFEPNKIVINKLTDSRKDCNFSIVNKKGKKSKKKVSKEEESKDTKKKSEELTKTTIQEGQPLKKEEQLVNSTAEKQKIKEDKVKLKVEKDIQSKKKDDKSAKQQDLKEEKARIKAEKEAEKQKIKEEKARIKAEKEAEKQRIKEEKARIKAEKEAEKQKIKEEKARIKAEKEAEKQRIKEEKARKEAQEKLTKKAK